MINNFKLLKRKNLNKSTSIDSFKKQKKQKINKINKSRVEATDFLILLYQLCVK